MKQSGRWSDTTSLSTPDAANSLEHRTSSKKATNNLSCTNSIHHIDYHRRVLNSSVSFLLSAILTI